MKYKLLNILSCPNCKGTLTIKVFSCRPIQDQSAGSKEVEILDGILECGCGNWYPIINGVPRLLLGVHRNDLKVSYPDYFRKHSEGIPQRSSDPCFDICQNDVTKIQRKTMHTFGYEWKKFSDYSLDNFTEFIEPLGESFFKGKLGLDAGCGGGRHVRQASQFGSEMVGIDVSESVDVTYENNRDNHIVHVIQADILKPPFRENTFDFVYSLGVLHHLPCPQEGFEALSPLLKKDAPIFIWVYYKTFRKELLESLRKFTTKLPASTLDKLAFLCTLLDFGLFINSYKFLNKIPIIKPLINSIAPPRIREYANYDFRINHTDWFDRLSAPISNFYKEVDIRIWFENKNLKDIQIHRVGDSWVWGFGRK